jgi:hypothetical protein
MGSMRVMKPGLRRKTCMPRGAGIAVLIGEAAITTTTILLGWHLLPVAAAASCTIPQSLLGSVSLKAVSSVSCSMQLRSCQATREAELS